MQWHFCHALRKTLPTQVLWLGSHRPSEAGHRVQGKNKEAGMNKMTFPNACQVMRWHFHPLGFEASMDAPRSMVARLFDRATGETLLAIAGIPCAAIMPAADVERIIEAVEAEMDAFEPSYALRDAV